MHVCTQRFQCQFLHVLRLCKDDQIQIIRPTKIDPNGKSIVFQRVGSFTLAGITENPSILANTALKSVAQASYVPPVAMM